MKCYLCQKGNLKIIRRKLRYGIKRNVLQCGNCGLVFLQPKKDNLKKYYSQGEYRKLHSPVIGKKLSAREIFDIYSPYQHDRLRRIKHILCPQMNVLEIGCSAGHFLSLIKKHVGECTGIELNKDDARFVNNVIKVKTYTEPIENTDIPPEHFDLICSFQVLEHLEGPLNFLRKIKEYLKPAGYLYLEIPNVQDALIDLYKVAGYRDFMFQEPHLYYFSPKTLGLLLKKAGFKGKIYSSQSYNFLNQINWILTGRPQPNASIGMSDSVLVHNCSKKYKEACEEINRFVVDADRKYKDILVKHFLGDNLIFIGTKDKRDG